MIYLFRIFKDEKIRRKKSNFTNINTRKCFNLPRLLEIINGLCMFVVITIN